VIAAVARWRGAAAPRPDRDATAMPLSKQLRILRSTAPGGSCHQGRGAAQNLLRLVRRTDAREAVTAALRSL
jgi:hypothetical protein